MKTTGGEHLKNRYWYERIKQTSDVQPETNNDSAEIHPDLNEHNQIDMSLLGFPTQHYGTQVWQDWDSNWTVRYSSMTRLLVMKTFNIQ